MLADTKMPGPGHGPCSAWCKEQRDHVQASTKGDACQMNSETLEFAISLRVRGSGWGYKAQSHAYTQTLRQVAFRALALAREHRRRQKLQLTQAAIMCLAAAGGL